mmetsp:Transcript_7283/g.8380  ORF Transcript_7283/g.8380 Transcript_7283/m.8380 type:complete len:111 (-) Transcript_7283:91-423(-)
MDRKVKRITETLAAKFERLYYNGLWLAPEMELVRNSIKFGQRDVEGSVKMKLYKGNITVLGQKSLYNADLASMDIEGRGDAFDYNPPDAKVFLGPIPCGLKRYIQLKSIQ